MGFRVYKYQKWNVLTFSCAGGAEASAEGRVFHLKSVTCKPETITTRRRCRLYNTTEAAEAAIASGCYGRPRPGELWHEIVEE